MKKIFAEVFGLALFATAAHHAAASTEVGGIEIGGSGAKGFIYERVPGYGIKEADGIKVSESHFVSPAKEFISQNQRFISALREEMIPPEDIDRIAEGVAKIYEEFEHRNSKLSGLYLVGSSSVEKNRNTSELAKAIKEKIPDSNLKLEFISHGQETFYSLFDAVYKHRNSGMCNPYGNSLILGVDSGKAVIAAYSGKTGSEARSFDHGFGADKSLDAEVIDAIKSLATKEPGIKTIYLTVGKSIGFPDQVLKIAGQINKEIRLPIRFVQDGDSDEIGRQVSNMAERGNKLRSLPECANLENSVVLDVGAGNTKLGYLDKTTRTYTLHSHEISYGAATLGGYMASRPDEMCFALPDHCEIRSAVTGLADLRKRLLPSHPRLFEETSKGYRNVFVVGGTPWVTTKITRLDEISNDYSCINRNDIENVMHDASPLRTLLEQSLNNATRSVNDELKKHINEYEGAERTAFVNRMHAKTDAMVAEVEKVLSVYPLKTEELRSGALLAYWIFNELSDSSHENRLWIRQQLNQLNSLFDSKSKAAADIKNRESLKRARTAFDANDYEQAQKSINGVVARLTTAHVGKLIEEAERTLATGTSSHARNITYRVDKRIVRELLNLASDRMAHDDIATAYHLLSDANAAIIDPAFAKPVSIGTCETHEGTANARQFLVPNRVNDWLRWHIMNKEGVLIDALKYMGLIDLNFLMEPELRAQFVPEYVPTVNKRSRDIQRD